MDHSGSWEYTLLIAGALQAGIIDHLSEHTATAAEMATACDIDTRATGLTLASLADLNIANSSISTPSADQLPQVEYGLSAEARASLVNEDSPSFSRYVILHRADMIRRWLEIPEVLESGKPVEQFTDETKVLNFYGAMTANGRARAGSAIDRLVELAPGAKTAVDLGGATGVYSVEMAKRGLITTLVDLPSTVERVENDLLKQGVAVYASDFFDSMPEGPFDIALVAGVTHIYGPQENIDLFTKVRDILDPKAGRIAIVDFIRGESPRADLFAINMLVHTKTGSTWTRQDYEKWLAGAGFQEPNFIDLDGHNHLIVAEVLNQTS